MEVTADAEKAGCDTIVELASGGRWRLACCESCTPGYYNNEGKPNPLAKQSSPYGGGSIRFFKLLKEWREDGKFEGLQFGA